MSAASILPRRWLGDGTSAEEVEAMAPLLETAPISAARDGLAILLPLGAESLLPGLVALKSLHRAIGRGRAAILDDGTLTARDRAILAHHADDPEMLRAAHANHGPLPPGGEWSALLTMLDRRRSEYWIQLDPHCLTLGPLDEIASAIGRNRSHLMMANGERRSAGIAGFAAGGAGRDLAVEIYAHACNRHSTARDLVTLLFERETDPVRLPGGTYCEAGPDGYPDGAKLVFFDRDCRAAHATAASAIIEDLPRS